MVNFEKKLSDWFKLVDKSEEEVARKKTGVAPQPAEPAPVPEEQPQPRVVEMRLPAREAPKTSVAAAAETAEVVTNVAVAEPLTGPARPVSSEPAVRPALFEETDVPQVEDFFSFLSKNGSSAPPAAEPATEPEPEVFRVPDDQGTLHFSEGTGEPRPIVLEPKPVPPVVAPTPAVEAPRIQTAPATVAPVAPTVRPEPVQAPVVVEPAPVVESEPAKPVAAPTPQVGAAEPKSAEERLDRLPRHLRTLSALEDVPEIAQNSYKTFKETRAQLIERLLDPVVSLEEAARILNVCPTTVRRYTNRGALKCIRTAGNQRRFKLSEVLSFMEKGQNGRGGSDE